MLSGFINEEHRALFEAGRALKRRGGALAECCGAKTRSGGTCKAPPLAGHNRCLKHAGPKAARAHRDHQLRELAAGRLSPAAFAAAEARRAANRLRSLWKKSPWWPGATIDLAAHEDAFEEELRARGWKADALPPAVADWARWRFRRAVIDRRQPAKWAETLDGLRDRVNAAGDPPPHLGEAPLSNAAFIVPDRLPVYSRRRALDPDRPRGRRRPRPRGGVERDASETAAVLARHGRDLAPVLGLCETAAQQAAVAWAYDALASNPGAPGAFRDWMRALAQLRP